MVSFDPMNVLRHLSAGRNTLTVVQAASEANEVLMTTEAISRKTGAAGDWVDGMVAEAHAAAEEAENASCIVSTAVKTGADALTILFHIDRFRACTLDYNYTGKQDRIVFYGSGTGYVSIIAHDTTKNVFTFVYTRPTNKSKVCIGGFDTIDVYDQCFLFNYDHSGKMDHLVCYRPGTKVIAILKNGKGLFSPVFQIKVWEAGIGRFDWSEIEGRGFALDYEHSEKMDHVLFY
ncbi:hypothetical protein K432DRAFT_430417 [Lepidopterella palustris CBS 459.81]|uniref:Uncharacterized protein n=1 Tax=Lepidopterella palustris CBS 459.81 TaxID=1314670 RepID=A0A8E2DYA5_9PEZI|nr:hypothetical protein K432DRAFT_430417 [Lepidopterella palustris CBS 459.81]